MDKKNIFKRPFFKQFIKYLIIVAVLVGCIYLLLYKMDLSILWHYITNARWEFCVLTFIMAFVSHYIRSIRWRIYTNPLKPKIPYFNLFSSTMIGYAINNITPRGGEFVRPIVLARREGISASGLLATIVVERFVDLVWLILIIFLVFYVKSDLITNTFPSITPTMLTWLSIGTAIVIIVIMIVITTSYLDNLIIRLAKKILPKHSEKISNIWISFKNGFSSLKDIKSYLGNFVLTTALWAAYSFQNYICFFAFDFQYREHLTFVDGVMVMIASGVATTLAPTPGAIGVTHLALTGALVALHPGISQEEALAYATVAHFINLLFQVSSGGLCAIRENIKGITKEKIKKETL